MFDVGFSELVLLFVIGLLILGPERLPRVAAQIGRWLGRARRTAHQLRMQIEREMTLNDIIQDTHERAKKNQTTGSSAAKDSEQEELDSSTDQYDDDDDNHIHDDRDHSDAGADDDPDDPEPSATTNSKPSATESIRGDSPKT